MHFTVSGVDDLPFIPPLVAFLVSSLTSQAPPRQTIIAKLP